MDERITLKKYKGREIMIVDYTDLRYEKLGILMEASKKKIMASKKKDVLLLEIVTGVKIDQNTSGALKKYAAEIKPYLHKYAVVGIKGGTRVLATMLKVLNIIMIEPCSSAEEALEYLVE